MLQGLPPNGQDGFNPFPNYAAPLQHEAFTREAFARDNFNHQVFQRASQDSNASTRMHTDGRPSIDDRPSMESLRSGHGSPRSPMRRSGPADASPFAYTDHWQQHQQQYQAQHQPQHQPQHQQQQSDMLPSVRTRLMGSLGSLLGSGTGLEIMPEDEDVKVGCCCCCYGNAAAAGSFVLCRLHIVKCSLPGWLQCLLVCSSQAVRTCVSRQCSLLLCSAVHLPKGCPALKVCW